MRRATVVLLSLIMLILVSCAKDKPEDIVKPESEGKEEVSIIPSYSFSDEQYKILLPYRPSAARGTITNQITNRLDMNELEEGLRRHSVSVFDPEKYVFEEGQYLSTDKIYELIDSLNPTIKNKSSQKEHRKNPRVFSHILEQNYLERKDNRVDLVGVSIGISLKSVYRFTTETGGPYYYEEIPRGEMLEEGKKIAQKVLEEIREIDELVDVPIMIALFREEEQSAPIPGQFVAKTVVDEGENEIGKWKSIKEENILIPSEKAKEKYPTDQQKVKLFADKIAEYFPNYVGVIANGFYIDEELTRMTLDVPIEFYGKGEVIGFTQYVYGLVKEIFPNNYDIEISIESSDGAESLIYRKSGDEEPKVHVYH